jgi:hypothetical protein
VITNDSSDNSGTGTTNGNIKAGWEVESYYYPSPSKSGLAFMARFLSADHGTYIGPGIYYVSRPRSGVMVHVGANFPFGSNVVHFDPEFGIGFQF